MFVALRLGYFAIFGAKILKISISRIYSFFKKLETIWNSRRIFAHYVFDKELQVRVDRPQPINLQGLSQLNLIDFLVRVQVALVI